MDNEATVCTSSQLFRAVQIQFNSQRNHGQADHVNLKRTNKKKTACLTCCGSSLMRYCANFWSWSRCNLDRDSDTGARRHTAEAYTQTQVTDIWSWQT